MNLDIDYLINFMKKYSSPSKSELGEQETPAAGGDAGGSTSSAPAQKKWESGRKLGKTYMNDPKYAWKSDRTMGKTYMGDPKYKWYSGVQRGHANPASEA
jgi:hypothetical protein